MQIEDKKTHSVDTTMFSLHDLWNGGDELGPFGRATFVNGALQAHIVWACAGVPIELGGKTTVNHQGNIAEPTILATLLGVDGYFGSIRRPDAPEAFSVMSRQGRVVTLEFRDFICLPFRSHGRTWCNAVAGDEWGLRFEREATNLELFTQSESALVMNAAISALDDLSARLSGGSL
jgi:hypothetical protein